MPDVKIQQRSVCEGDEREGIHVEYCPVDQSKDHLNAEEEDPCRHYAVGGGEWPPGGNKHPGKKRLGNTQVENRFNEIHSHHNIQ